MKKRHRSSLLDSEYFKDRTFAGADPLAAAYLDYSGAQDLVYVILTKINELGGKHIAGLGFRLWTLFWCATALGLIYWRRNSTSAPALSAVIIPAMFFSFEPIFSDHLYMRSWEDKLPFFVLPLLTLALWEKGKVNLASAVVGFASTFNGSLIWFTPIWTVYLIKTLGRRSIAPIGIFVFAALVTFLPYFPSGLSGWHNRSHLVGLPPFWFSIYLPISKFTLPE